MMETPHGELIVYGTVMPWHSDRGKPVQAAGSVARNWDEHPRVVPEQGAEWAAPRAAYPGVQLCVADDFNSDLCGAAYDGTKRGRVALAEGLRAADLVCLTSTDRVPPGLLRHPPIDHVCVSAALGEDAAIVDAWDGPTPDGVRLSDHSALVVELAR